MSCYFVYVLFRLFVVLLHFRYLDLFISADFVVAHELGSLRQHIHKLELNYHKHSFHYQHASLYVCVFRLALGIDKTRNLRINEKLRRVLKPLLP